MFLRAVLVTGSLIGSATAFGFLGTIMALKSGVPVSAVHTIMSLAIFVPVLSAVFYHGVPQMGTLAGIILAGVSVHVSKSL